MGSNSRQIFKARVSDDCDIREREQLREKITELKTTLRQFELKNEKIQLSESEEPACPLVEPNVEFENGP